MGGHEWYQARWGILYLFIANIGRRLTEWGERHLDRDDPRPILAQIADVIPQPPPSK